MKTIDQVAAMIDELIEDYEKSISVGNFSPDQIGVFRSVSRDLEILKLSLFEPKPVVDKFENTQQTTNVIHTQKITDDEL